MLQFRKQNCASEKELLESVRKAKSQLKIMKLDEDAYQKFFGRLDKLDTVISEADEVVGPLRTDLYSTVDGLPLLCLDHECSKRTSKRISSATDNAFYEMCKDLDDFVDHMPVSPTLTVLPLVLPRLPLLNAMFAV